MPQELSTPDIQVECQGGCSSGSAKGKVPSQTEYAPDEGVATSSTSIEERVLSDFISRTFFDDRSVGHCSDKRR